MAQITAAVIGTNAGYILLTFLPPVIWLLFYLKEDRRPEPKRLLFLTFVGGMISAVVAIFVEVLLLGQGGLLPRSFSMEKNAFLFFLVIGVVEEYVKYLPVKFLIVKRPDFDEPVDAMIYLMTAALGFAALENTLFAFPTLSQSFLGGLEVVANRFLGANLLHALSSGIVGFFLAKSILSPYRRHLVALGITIASLLHALFNYLILVRGAVDQGTFYLFLLLAIMLVVVLLEFEQLKRKKINLNKVQ